MAQGRAANRVPYTAVSAIGVLAWALMIPTYWNTATGYLVGTSIAVIGLYIAFILPVILRFRQGDSVRARRLEPRASTTSGSTSISIIWVAIISILFLGPVTPTGIPWKDGFNWDVANYAPLTVGGALLLFGGWWLISAKNWFKGPVRMGTEEELERMEEGGGFKMPPESRAGVGRLARRGARRPSAPQLSTALRNAGSAAVRPSRSKCCAA